MPLSRKRGFQFVCAGMLVAGLGTDASAEPKLFESSEVTPAGEYTKGIEGPAVDADGNLYVVNFGRPGTIGKLAAGAAQSQKAFDLPAGSIGSAIRIDAAGTMFIADYKKHNVFAVKDGGLVPEVYFHSDLMNQPNDITLARDGTIYASDPTFKGRRGQIWRIAKSANGSVQGTVMTASRPMGTTNGIDLSPDGATLYVGESNTGEVWAYRLNGAELAAARLVRAFEPDTIDGIRTDVAGRLLIARIRKGAIAVVAPDGSLQREIIMRGEEPTNLAFGGADGRTVFVTQRQGGFVEAFQTDQEGREHCLQTRSC
ncbi:MAG: SMP-30/gluconolactonase/LRE family protein [Bradyrhizobium sp.]|nr:SMP-30/gluconolactonase/LRE family protein [Bradyrhizobium sp.]